MKLREFLAATAAVRLVAAPVAAQAAAAEDTRTGTPVEGEGIGGGLLLPILAVLAVAAAIYLITDDSDEEPTSP